MPHMKKGLTYIIFVIDRSGSMESIYRDMIGGFNSFITTQRKNPGAAKVFAYKFDTVYEPMFENVDIQDQSVCLNEKNYQPRGSTALNDSLGKTIVDVGVKLSALPESERPEKVLLVTITDGMDNEHLDNTDKRYNNAQIKEMIDHQTKVYNWDFAYIGANQDAWAVGSSMGYSLGTTLDYCADSDGVACAFDNLSKSTTNYRSAPMKKFVFCPGPDDEDDDKSSKKS